MHRIIEVLAAILHFNLLRSEVCRSELDAQTCGASTGLLIVVSNEIQKGIRVRYNRHGEIEWVPCGPSGPYEWDRYESTVGRVTSWVLNDDGRKVVIYQRLSGDSQNVFSATGPNWRNPEGGSVNVPAAGSQFRQRRDPLRQSVVGIKPSGPGCVHPSGGRTSSAYTDLALVGCKAPKGRAWPTASCHQR